MEKPDLNKKIDMSSYLQPKPDIYESESELLEGFSINEFGEIIRDNPEAKGMHR